MRWVEGGGMRWVEGRGHEMGERRAMRWRRRRRCEVVTMIVHGYFNMI